MDPLMSDHARVDDRELRLISNLMEQVKPLRESTNLYVSVAAERIVALFTDVLYELDPDLADPWQHLAPGVPPVNLEDIGQ
jgi:hypothetical protein